MLSVHSSSRCFIAVLVFAVCAGRAFSQNTAPKEPLPQNDVSVLIDKLQEIAEGDAGYMSTMSGIGFLPLGTSQAGAFLLGQKPTTPSSTLRELVKRGAPAVPYLIAARHGHVKVAEVLLACGAPVNATDGESKLTPLHLAAGAGRSQVVALLLAHNADRRAQSWDGKTALSFALKSEDQETIRLLKEER